MDPQNPEVGVIVFVCIASAIFVSLVLCFCLIGGCFTKRVTCHCLCSAKEPKVANTDSQEEDSTSPAV